jgi:hypothetical protein
MAITRRSIVQASFVAAAAVGFGAGIPAGAAKQDATPDAEALPVDVVYQRLRESTPTSPLFPSDYGDLAIIDWVDDNDTDLAGTVGAVFVQDTAKGERDEGMIGAYIVHPKIAQAKERIAEQTSDGGEDNAVTLFGRPTAQGQFDDGFSLIAVAQGFVIVSAIGMPAKRPGPEESLVDFRETDARALSHLAGLLDHLRLVLTAA